MKFQIKCPKRQNSDANVDSHANVILDCFYIPFYQ